MTASELAANLTAYKPNAQWVLYGNTYDGLVWLDQVQTKPTQEEWNTNVETA